MEILTYRQIHKTELKKKTKDPNNYLKNIDITKITDNICYSNDENVGLFLKDNTHLINYYKLAKNGSDWALFFCLEYIYNNNNNYHNYDNYDNYNDRNKLCSILSSLINTYDKKIFTDDFCELIYKNKLLKNIDIDKKEKLYNYVLNKIKEETNKELIKYNIYYLLEYCNLEDLKLLKNIFPNLLPNRDKKKEQDQEQKKEQEKQEQEKEEMQNENNYYYLFKNNNTEIVKYILSDIKFENVYDIEQFCMNTNDIAVNYIIENYLESNNTNSDDLFLIKIRFYGNSNDIAVNYLLDKFKNNDKRYDKYNHSLYNNPNDKMQDYLENKY